MVALFRVSVKLGEVHCDPIVARQQDDLRVIKGLMRENFVTTIPIVDQLGKVVDVIRKQVSESVTGSSTQLYSWQVDLAKGFTP